MAEEQQTFIKVTNADIYKKLMDIDKRAENIEKHAIQTNGKVRLNTFQIKMLSGAIIIIITVLIWIFQNVQFR